MAASTSGWNWTPQAAAPTRSACRTPSGSRPASSSAPVGRSDHDVVVPLDRDRASDPPAAPRAGGRRPPWRAGRSAARPSACLPGWGRPRRRRRPPASGGRGRCPASAGTSRPPRPAGPARPEARGGGRRRSPPSTRRARPGRRCRPRSGTASPRYGRTTSTSVPVGAQPVVEQPQRAAVLVLHDGEPRSEGRHGRQSGGSDRLRASRLAEPQRGQGSRHLQHPLEGLAVVLSVRRLRGGQIAVDVLDGRLELVQPVVQRVELGPRHDQAGVAQPEVGRLPARLVVALPAAPAAVHPRPARAGHDGERASTPPAPAHDRSVTRRDARRNRSFGPGLFASR